MGEYLSVPHEIADDNKVPYLNTMMLLLMMKQIADHKAWIMQHVEKIYGIPNPC